MFTPNSPSNNRLLALEQELMGWKTSPKPQQAQQEEEEDGMLNSEAETEEVAAWDSEIEEVEELEEAGETEQFSYGALAKMLQSSSSERFKRNVTQLQAKWNGLESLAEEEETVFAYPSRRNTLPSAPIHSDRDAPSNCQFSQLPELDLPRSNSSPEIFDIALPEAEPDAPSPVPNFAFSSGEPSYTSLLQVIQSARQSKLAPDVSDDPILSTAKTDRTIDVESHAIAEEKASYPLAIPEISELALTATVEQSLLPAKPIAFGLEPIELEPISDEDDEDGWDESSDNQLSPLSPTNQE